MDLIKHELYNGDKVVYFNDKRHMFYDENMKHIKISVTGATGVLDKSGALMGWVAKMMGLYLVDNWDPKKINQESQKLEIIELAKRKYRDAQKEAADIGTAIHEWVSEKIKGNNPAMPENEKVVNGITAFLKFQKEHKVDWIVSERAIYSKKHQYAGFLDGIGIMDGELITGDFKSSGGIYEDMVFQVEGYKSAIEEELEYLMKLPLQRVKNPADKELVKAYKKHGGFGNNVIIRFGKEDGAFEFCKFNDHKRDLTGFMASLNLRRSSNLVKDELKEIWKSKNK